MQFSVFKIFQRGVKILAFLLLTTSCNDLFLQDLEGEEVDLIAPANGIETTNTQLLLIWEELDGASEYRLQIASPNFVLPEEFILDSLTSNNQYLVNLLPGDYQWRVRGINDGSETDWATNALRIDSTTDISGSQVFIYGPEEYLNYTNPSFDWDALYNAEAYSVEIYEGSFLEGPLYLPRVTTPFPFFDPGLDFPEGEYEWGVSAEAGTSRTVFTVQKMVIDTTLPEMPFLNLPLENDTLSDSLSINFSWEDPKDRGAPLQSIFIISQSESGDNPVVSEQISDFTYSKKLEKGVYFWQIQYQDLAGNKGTGTIFRKLNIQ